MWAAGPAFSWRGLYGRHYISLPSTNKTTSSNLLVACSTWSQDIPWRNRGRQYSNTQVVLTVADVNTRVALFINMWSEQSHLDSKMQWTCGLSDKFLIGLEMSTWKCNICQWDTDSSGIAKWKSVLEFLSTIISNVCQTIFRHLWKSTSYNLILLTFRWCHSHYTEAATERYLNQRDKAPSYHKAIAEYFLDMWNAKPKPCSSSENTHTFFSEIFRQFILHFVPFKPNPDRSIKIYWP